MNCKICNDVSQEPYCRACSKEIRRLQKPVSKKELGRNSIHADIVKMLNELNKTIPFSSFKKDAGVYSQNGVSDFSITYPVIFYGLKDKPIIGVHIACEVKAGKNKLSALQAEYLRKHIVDGKSIGIVVRSADELKNVLAFIDSIFKKMSTGTPYQECHNILARSWQEITDALEKVDNVFKNLVKKGAKKGTIEEQRIEKERVAKWKN